MKIANSEQMREMDRRTIEEFHIPGLILMENAALRVVDALSLRFGPLFAKRIAVVCGGGDNGGDGMAIARHLSSRFNALVTIWLSVDFNKLKGEALSQFQMAQAYGLDFKSSDSIDLSQADLVIDALFGTGIKGAVIGKSAAVIRAINESRKPVISVDVPSGLETNTGRAEGAVVQASMTVTFTLAKFGEVIYPGATFAGELLVENIGTPQKLIDACPSRTFCTQASDVATWLPTRVEARDSNKGTFGHVVIFAGAEGFAGAPALVADSAARAGCGLVTLVVPKEIQPQVVSQVSSVVMTRGLREGYGGTFGEDSVDEALMMVEKASAVAIGPGIGGGDEVAAFVRAFVSRCQKPIVIDADAINLLAKESDRGVSVLGMRKAATILTPHPTELGRLLAVKTEAIEADRSSFVMQASREYGCVVVLKGASTLTASQEGQIYVNQTGNPGMATGGTGDALTGVIAGLLAQHLRPLEAAAAGVHIHGLAADLAAKAFGGTTGLIATDIIKNIPQAIAKCQLSK